MWTLPGIAIFVVGTFSSIPQRATAQTPNAFTNATCAASYSWSYNSLGQSPCLVAAYLSDACSGYGEVLPLEANHYYGPSIPPLSCQCSTVVYSVFSACGACQGGLFPDWSTWDENCTSVYINELSIDIPAGTAVPPWAYLDVSTTNTFNLVAAEADTNTIDSTGVGKPTVGISSTIASTTPAVTVFPSVYPSPSPSPVSDNSSSSSTPAGAIAGAVVGGLLLVAIIALASWYYERRKRNRVPPSAEFAGYGNGLPMSPPPMSFYSGQDSVSTRVPKLYDPADPSTYPDTVTPIPHQELDTVDYVSHQMPDNHGYSGVPEV